MAKRLYVGNLPVNMDDTILQSLFVPHGTVSGANVIADRVTGECKGYGFVEMASQEEAQAAMAALDGKEYEGQILKVDPAKPRRHISGGRGGGRGGYGDGGGRSSRRRHD
ncbi:MAG: hypothetical protein JW810_09820 [Sedimentisphaerales bacterium]|nr:hypothetical protein [Sedimentisphaerales bacterium]